MTGYHKYYIAGGILAGIGGLILYTGFVFLGLFSHSMPLRFWVAFISSPIMLVLGGIILIIGLVKSKHEYDELKM